MRAFQNHSKTNLQRIRFTINAGAVQRAGLKISSKLLRLARIVAEMPAEEER